MSAPTLTAHEPTANWAAHPGTLRCVACGDGVPLPSVDGSALTCDRCGHAYLIADGVLVVNDSFRDNNRIVSDYYNGPLWPKFRFWERYTWTINGGERRSRDKVLRHLPQGPGLKLLDVAVGDGAYLDWFPKDWSVVGVDVSVVQLDDCRKRLAKSLGRDVQLILGEAEDLPVRDGTFDAALSFGAFNYFNDPEKALREMIRAVKPGGTIVISDEVPNLPDLPFFGKIGLPQLDRWFARKVMKDLSDEFAHLVDRKKSLDIRELAHRVLPGSTYEEVWYKVGYVVFGTVPG